jgi:protein-S-isoprenylcysteine O-methyltransferase Ste14
MKVVAAWGAFALFHSLTVSERYERWARGFLGDERFRAYHRLLFTLYSAAATAAAVVAYFYLGTFFEERRLVRKFGEEYRAYQRRVPRFFPLPRP